MGKISLEHIQTIKQYFRTKTNIAYVILFGSALKVLRPQSDIDLLIGGKVTFNQRLDMAMGLEKKLNRKVDVVSSAHAFCELAIQAYAEGKAIHVRSRPKLLEDYYRHRYEFDNTMYLRKIRADKVRAFFSNGQ